MENPSRCFVRLFKLYNELCPSDRPHDAFYLAPLKKPRKGCWFSRNPLGKHKLAKAVATMCKQCGIEGYKTNHSLRATAATRLYSSGVDEQLIMERTGHHSTEGIRCYKHTTTEQQEAVSDILSNAKRPCTDIALLSREVASFTGQSENATITDSNSTTISMPHFSASKTDHTGGFHFTSCSNITINFK